MSTRCPLSSVDLLDPTLLRDPYPTFARLRDTAPVHFDPALGAFLVTRFDLIDRVLRDPRTFISANVVRPIAPLCSEAQAILAAGLRTKPVLASSDPPRHTEMRSIVTKGFTRTRMIRMEQFIRDGAAEAVDALMSTEIADFYETVAFPLPAALGLTLLGFPREDIPALKRWAASRVLLTWGRLDAEAQVAAARDLVEHWEYTVEFVRSRMERPEDDFTSHLVRVHRADPTELTTDELITMVHQLNTAAHETTTNLLLNGLRALLEDRRQWVALRDDRSLVPNAVEEALRFDASILNWRRTAAHDAEIEGVVIPAGSDVVLMFGAGNRDDRHFEHPDRFDVHRRNARDHFSFGRGIHYCAGAVLARLEGRIVFETLLDRCPEITLVEQELEYAPNLAFHGPLRLLVRTGRA